MAEERLTGPNYRSWATAMKAALERKGVWDVIALGRSAPARKELIKQVNKTIIDTLEPHVLREVLQSASPWSIWQTVSDRYRDDPFGCVINKAFEYLDCEFAEEEESLTAHILQMERHATTLAAMGMSVPDELQTLLLLKSIRHSRYASVIQVFRKYAQPPTRAHVVDTLLRSTAPSVSTTASVHSDGTSSTISRATEESSTAAAKWSASESPQPTTAEFDTDTINAFARAMLDSPLNGSQEREGAPLSKSKGDASAEIEPLPHRQRCCSHCSCR
ncbi:hypothetical protein PINS_up012458 [Pythium insidiosum]|nr:hypothetical protein PINS_up012458 [Pythium insidiosum]